MSLFKEKDEYIIKAFEQQFNYDSDEDDTELKEEDTEPKEHDTKPKETEVITISSDLITISSDDDDIESTNITRDDSLQESPVPPNNTSQDLDDCIFITVKLQDGNSRHTKEYRIIKDEPMLKLKQRYAKEFEIRSIDTIRLCFDGDVVEDESTPEELDIEDDCIIDVMF